MSKKSIPLQSGQKIGRLTVISLHHILPYKRKNGIIENMECYLCKCDCGNTKIVYKLNLGRDTNSCGCLKKTHGMSKTRIYRTRGDMVQRCYNEKEPSYKNYGARGIKMCDEWKKDFMAFYNWAINNGYKENLTIDRIDVNGNYEPNNCRWATVKEQGRNQRRNHIVEYNGEKHCIVEWAEKLGIKPDCIYSRFRRGWAVEKTLSTKVL